jgi:hypothetical protein
MFRRELPGPGSELASIKWSGIRVGDRSGPESPGGDSGQHMGAKLASIPGAFGLQYWLWCVPTTNMRLCCCFRCRSYLTKEFNIGGRVVIW